MATDSSQAGYLQPVPPPPLYDDDLEDLFQQVVVGITAVPGNLVRPRWQPDPPNLPAEDVDWIALGVSITGRQWDPAKHWRQDVGPSGVYMQEGCEVMEVFLSFYGPNHSKLRRQFEDGLNITQNLDALLPQKISYQECRAPVNAPALLKARWFMRSDTKVVFHRWVERVYPVLTYQSATVSVGDGRITDAVSTTNFVTPSP